MKARKGMGVRVALGLAAAGLAAPALATETGGGVYPNGAENFLGGALPPQPGLYVLGYYEHYNADRFTDGKGDAGLLPDFRARADAVVGRYVLVTDKKLFGADLGMHVIVPMVNLRVSAGGASSEKTGVGDVTIDPILLGWHFRNGLSITTGIDINLPVGTYDRRSLANFSRHYWNVEPILAFAYYGKSGVMLDVKMMYDFNFRNRKAQINPFNPTGADYRSGQEFHTDFALGYAIGKWELGASGYYYRQTTGDRIRDAAAQAVIDGFDGFKGEVFAMGPEVRRTLGKVQLMGMWQHEFYADYRPRGERFWLKAIIPIGGKPRP